VRRRTAKYSCYLGLLAGIGLLLFWFERFLPAPLPWFKWGLSQICTLLALYLMGYEAALLVVFLRVLAAALILGSFASPAFWLSLGAGLAAAVTMAAARRIGRPYLTIFGVSLIGALTHNSVQLVLAYLLLVHHSSLGLLFPLVWFPAILSGLIVGYAAFLMLAMLARAGYTSGRLWNQGL
jgi:heptaprenyl diphosphate synthase